MKFPYTPENSAKMAEVGEYLLGSCQSLEDGLQSVFGDDADLMDFDIILLQELDDITMLCESCGWWNETGFIDDDGNCDDCTESSEDDED